MFICQQCQRQTQLHEKAHTLVIASRAHVHPPRSYLLRGERKARVDPGGSGAQIVRELRVCASCSPARGPATWRAADEPGDAPLQSA